MNQQQDRSETETKTEAEKEIVPAVESRGHRCKECNKIFSSGKALGGHVSSAHIQPANKDYSCKKLTKSKIEDSGSYSGSGSGSGSGPHSCVVCGRRFPSQKSLYGHMRCHPDREWRGMEPPLMRNELFSEEDSTDTESDYSGMDRDRDDGSGPDETVRPSLDFVWPVTGKRGRLALASPDRAWSLEDSAVSAGRQLLKLLNRMPDSGGKEVVAPVALKGPVPVDTVRLQNHMLSRQGPAQANIKKQEGDRFHPAVVKRPAVATWTTEEADRNEIQERDCKRPRVNHPEPKLRVRNTIDIDGIERESETEKGEFASEVDLFLEAVCVLSNGKREMTSGYAQKEEKLSPAHKTDHSGVESKHICGTCKKGFQSPQALGGHMSSHNKLRMNVANNVDTVNNNNNNTLQQPTTDIIGTSNAAANGGGKSVKAEQSHVCPVCKKGFTTGQALGGHKKRHNSKKNAVNVGDDSSKGGGEENDANVRDFDLNKKPDADAWS